MIYTASANKKAYESSVINAVLGHSVSKDYDKAKMEWDFTGTVNDYGELKLQKPVKKCQLCGHPIRYGYILKNNKNGKKVEVGSECIENYVNITPRKINAIEKAKKDAINERKRAIKHASDLAYSKALREAERVRKAVYAGKVYKDIDVINAIGNNRRVLHDRIKSGALYNLAKKYNVSIDKEKINDFMRTYTDPFK